MLLKWDHWLRFDYLLIVNAKLDGATTVRISHFVIKFGGLFFLAYFSMTGVCMNLSFKKSLTLMCAINSFYSKCVCHIEIIRGN